MNADKNKIQQSLALLYTADDVIELRSLGDRGPGNGFYGDWDKLIPDAAQLSEGGQHVYVCLNPAPQQLHGRRPDQFGSTKKGEGTSDHDIEIRRWLLVDIDPVRPTGVSATEQEKQASIVVAGHIYSYLRTELGENCLVVADSGNGTHILVRLPDVVSDGESDWICLQFLRMLDRKFSSELAKVDLTTHNASRICTLYGTVKRKGEDTSERPHRLSSLVRVPDPLHPVDWHKLTGMVEPYPGERPTEHQSTNNGFVWNLEQILDERKIQYVRDDEYRTKNGELATRYELSTCPFDPAHDDRSAYFLQWQNGAVCFGCHHNGCSKNKWQELKELWGLKPDCNISVTDIVFPQSSRSPSQLDNGLVSPVAPAEAFYGPIGQLVMKFAPLTEASPAAMLLLFLTHFGNAIGRRYYVDIGTRQFLKLFTVLVGTTARGRKGTADEAVCRMIEAINPAWMEYRHSGLSSGEGMLQVVANHMEGAYPAPALFSEGEFALVLRKKERQGNTLDGYLRVAWDDAVLATTTRKDPLRVEGSHISLVAHITPGELKELLTGRDISNGFANRYLWCWSSRPAQVPNAQSFQPADSNYYPEIQALKSASEKLQERYRGEPIRLNLDSEAKAKWPAIYAAIDTVESDEDEGLLVNINARAPALVQRIAGIFALADGVMEIGVRHLKAAVAITDYSLATVDYVYSRHWWTNGHYNPGLQIQRASKVLSALPINQPVKRSVVSHQICKRNRSAAELDEIRDYLTSAGSLRVEMAGKAENWIRLH